MPASEETRAAWRERSRLYRLRHLDEVRSRRRANYLVHRDRLNAKARTPEGRAAANARKQAYRARHKDDPNFPERTYRSRHRERAREAARSWWRKNASDPTKRLRRRVSALMRHCLKNGKTTSIAQSLGYSMGDLATHLERQFCRGMTWANMGEWHIDHIVPVSSFEIHAEGDAEFRRAWALTNLRPLWGNDNRRKAAKIEFLL